MVKLDYIDVTVLSPIFKVQASSLFSLTDFIEETKSCSFDSYNTAKRLSGCGYTDLLHALYHNKENALNIIKDKKAYVVKIISADERTRRLSLYLDDIQLEVKCRLMQIYNMPKTPLPSDCYGVFILNNNMTATLLYPVLELFTRYIDTKVSPSLRRGAVAECFECEEYRTHNAYNSSYLRKIRKNYKYTCILAASDLYFRDDGILTIMLEDTVLDVVTDKFYTHLVDLCNTFEAPVLVVYDGEDTVRILY